MRDKASGEDRAGHYAVVAAVRGGGDERLRVDVLPDAAVEDHHTEFHRDGGQHYNCRNQGEFHVLRGYDSLDSAFEQLNSDNYNEYRDNEPGYVLIPRVSVGVLGVGALFGELESDKADEAGRSVREVVERVRGDRNAPREGACDELPCAQEHIADYSDPARQPAIVCAFVIFFVFCRHKDTSSRKYASIKLHYEKYITRYIC